MQITELKNKYALTDEVTLYMLQYGFEAAEKAFTWPLPQLTVEAVERRWQELELPYTPQKALEVLHAAEKCEYFQHLYFYLYYYWYKLPDAQCYGYKLPALAECMGNEADSGLLELLLAIAGASSIEEKFASMNLPPEYAAAALKRIKEDSDQLSRFKGFFTYPAGGHHWMRFYVDGRLFRLGRLEYMVEPEFYPHPPYIFRERSSGRLIALCRENWSFNADGTRLWRDYPDEKPYMTAKFEETADFYRGTPVDPAGFADVDKVVTLEKSRFELFYTENDLIPYIHIPPGSNMDSRLVAESLKMAWEFYPKYLQKEIKVIISFSWIFNPDFCELLPGSNLAKFMQEAYLTPFSSDSLSGLSFVFGKQDKDWSSYPEENSLQRAFHTLRRQNRRLKLGGMFIEKRGIDSFGSRHYVREYQELMSTLHPIEFCADKAAVDA